MAMNCWQILGITPTNDETVIKKAYAAKIREHRPDRDPAGFRAVREAYESALQQRAFYAEETWEEEDDTWEDDDTSSEQESEDATLSDDEATPWWQTVTQNKAPFPLNDTANYAYQEPSENETTATDAPFPIHDTANYAYQDRNEGDTDTTPPALFTPDLLRDWRAQWQQAENDKALLSILQQQAASQALSNIEQYRHYSEALDAYFNLHPDRPLSYHWVQTRYHLDNTNHSHYREDLAERLYHYHQEWCDASDDAQLLQSLQQQGEDIALSIPVIRQAYLAALAQYLDDSRTRPRSYYWARTRYAPESEHYRANIPEVYRQYPEKRIEQLCQQLEQAADDASLLTLLEAQAEDIFLQYPPARKTYFKELAVLRSEWQEYPTSNHWLDTHYALPQLTAQQHEDILLYRLQQAWFDAHDETLLTILQRQARNYPIALQQIDFFHDYCAALQVLFMNHDLPHSMVWATAYYQLGYTDKTYQRRYQIALVKIHDAASFTAALPHSYPALAAWLQKSPLRRYLNLWRDWAVQKEVLAHQEWRQLRDDLAEDLLKYDHHNRATFHRDKRWLIIIAILFIMGIGSALSHHDGVSPQPYLYLLPTLFMSLQSGVWRRPTIHYDAIANHQLFNICPPLRTLYNVYIPLPQATAWFAADSIILILLYFATRGHYLATETLFTCGALWGMGRIGQILWHTKRAIVAGWQAPYPPAIIRPWLIGFYIIGIGIIGLLYSNLTQDVMDSQGNIYNLALSAQESVRAITVILSIAIYIYYWLRIPPYQPELRRSILDHGFWAVVTTISYSYMSKIEEIRFIALFICPVLILILHYRYHPPILSARMNKILSTIGTTILIYLLCFPLIAMIMPLLLPNSITVYGLVIMLVTPFILSLVLTLILAHYNHPRTLNFNAIMPSFMHYLSFVILICFYLLFLLNGTIGIALLLGAQTVARLTLPAFLLFILLHILASWKIYRDTRRFL
ncbi:MAG: J domain-containing protein [Cardiobacteriaceae bacterium]|nr:J domain-containing protein [Cardiobacteriaceae bacterium]